MADFIDRLFDPQASSDLLTPEALFDLNRSKSRGRLFDKLGTSPIPGEKALAASSALDHFDPKRNADRLRAIYADTAAPALNRALCASALYRADVDVGVAPSGVAALVADVLLGDALRPEMGDIEALVAALLATDLADPVVDAIERVRTIAGVPPDFVYGKALADPACRRAHARILDALDHDADTVAWVRECLESGALEADGFARYISRPEVSREPVGRVYHQGNCSGCGGAMISAIFEIDGVRCYLGAHVSHHRATDVAFVPYVSDAFVAEVAAELGDTVAEIPLANLAAAARGRYGEVELDERGLWLLRRFTPADQGIEAWLGEATPFEDEVGEHPEFNEEDAQDALAGLVAGDVRAVFTASELLESALFEGRFAVPADDLCRRLLAAFLDRVDRPVRWGDHDVEDLGVAWPTVAVAWDESDIHPKNLGLLPDHRYDRIDWRSLLATLVATDDIDAGVAAFRTIAPELLDQLRRTRKTPAQAVAEIGAPAAVTDALAARLRIDPDQPICDGLRAR